MAVFPASLISTRFDNPFSFAECSASLRMTFFSRVYLPVFLIEDLGFAKYDWNERKSSKECKLDGACSSWQEAVWVVSLEASENNCSDERANSGSQRKNVICATDVGRHCSSGGAHLSH